MTSSNLTTPAAKFPKPLAIGRGTVRVLSHEGFAGKFDTDEAPPSAVDASPRRPRIWLVVENPPRGLDDVHASLGQHASLQKIRQTMNLGIGQVLRQVSDELRTGFLASEDTRERGRPILAKWLYCWRCQMTVPMLEELEWEQLQPLLTGALRDPGSRRWAAGQVVYGQAALDRYFEISGLRETNANALWHHRLANFGPPCRACGKPLRTPRAKLCAACGTIQTR